jgi:hypothetical protein
MKHDLIVLGFLVIMVLSVAYLFKTMDDIRHKKDRKKNKRGMQK